VSKICISITLRLALSHVLFSLAFLKLMYKVLGAESCSGGDTQQPAAAVAASQNPPSKSLMSSFRESFISSGKQGGGATVLWEV
jgi:hypothetical protein